MHNHAATSIFAKAFTGSLLGGRALADGLRRVGMARRRPSPGIERHLVDATAGRADSTIRGDFAGD